LTQSRTPFLLSLIAAAAGLVGLLSALTPEWPLRLRIVQEVLSPTGPSVADGLVVASSIALLVLARGLARRRHRAWQAAMVLLGAGAVLHVLKGLDVEEATFDIFVMTLLWSQRGWFDAKGDPGGPLRALSVAVGSLAGLYAYGLGAIAVHEELGDRSVTLTRGLRQVTYGLVGLDLGRNPGRFAHELTLSLAAATIVLATYVLWIALRPRDNAVQQDPADRAEARRLVATAGGGDSLAYFALRRDKSYFFNAERTAFLAYRAVGGVALVSGDPIGDAHAFPSLVEQFATYCHEHAWRVAVMGVGADHREAWNRVGLRTLYIGDEAIVRPASFSLEGRPIRKVRQSVTRLGKAGYTSRVVRARDLTAAEWVEIDTVSHAWLHGEPERGFSMALDDMQDADHGDAVFTMALDPEGRIAGFVHFVPVGGDGSPAGLSLSSMRRLHDTPNGLTEFLLCETFAWGKEYGIDQVSLNFNAFGELMRSEADLPRIQRLVRFALGKADRYFQVERLLDFNRKFFPEWQPRYAAFERYADVPLGALVTLSVESLVTWPRPLRRLYARASA
jgi:lysyl-tRNA synthetase, class II